MKHGTRRHLDKEKLPNPLIYYRTYFGDLRTGSGDWASALCPFHSDTKPSFSVNLKHGGWKCFACGESGDLIQFHMNINHLTFIKAVTDLGGWD